MAQLPASKTCIYTWSLPTGMTCTFLVSRTGHLVHNHEACLSFGTCIVLNTSLRPLWSTLRVFSNRPISREWHMPVTYTLSCSFPGERGYCLYNQILRKVHIDECTYQHCLSLELQLELLLSIIFNTFKYMSLFYRYWAIREEPSFL
jgi:hypothetical protein